MSRSAIRDGTPELDIDAAAGISPAKTRFSGRFPRPALVRRPDVVVTGFLVEQDPQTVTLRSPDGQSVVLDRAELEELNKSRKSLMPEGQLKELSDEQLRNLFAYLRSSQPLND